ncbi:hypothetical protein JCM10213_003761 [Rhodosporidiobolus nylandii]
MPSLSPSSTADEVAALKAILTRTGERNLSTDDLKQVYSALTSAGERHTLALAVLSRFLAPSPTSTTRSSLQTSLETLLSGTDSSELVEGFSALSAVLQVAPQVAAALLQDNPLRSHLEEAVEHISKPVGKGKAKQDEETLALVELLSHGAGQPSTRRLVKKSAGLWLEGLLGEPESVEQQSEPPRARLRALAAVGVVKLRLGKEEPSMTGLPTPPEEDAPSRWSLDELAQLLVRLVQATTTDNNVTGEGVLLPALEGLAYLTLTSSTSVKETASDPSFLAILFSFAPKTPEAPNATSSARHFALATLLDHLTAFPPSPDGESDAAQLARLKRFAAAAARKGQAAPSLERESVESVSARVARIAKNEPSPIPTIRQLCLSPSLQTRRLAAKILHALVTPQALRGTLLQSGAARLFLSLIRQLPSPFSPAEDTPAIQGLAKLLITANPLLVLGPTTTSPLLFEATTALTLPLGATPSTSEPVGLLPRFESLMALTNIASLDPSLADQLARMTLRDRQIPLLTAVEELMLSSNAMVRRAATELVCNLAASDPGIEYFEPPSSPPADLAKPPSTKLHLLLALSSSPDLPTRTAATGALTSLVYSPAISLALTSCSKWVGMLLAPVEDEDPGVRHRAYEVWRVAGEMVQQADAAKAEKAKAGLRLAAKKLREAEAKEKVLQLKEVASAAMKAMEGV